MLYHSTRSETHFVDSAEAVLEGLAPDGGLYMPESIPAFDWRACLRGSSTEMSAKILAALLPDIPDMDTLVRRAYQGKFETEDLTPTVSVGGYSVLELFRGPTSAFKDVALSMLPQLLTAAKAVKGMEKDILILTATSGDTGKAALEGFRDVPGVRICVFYPDGGVSQVQRAQMVTQEGGNVAVSAVRGNFDDAQTGVKNIFAACQGRGAALRPVQRQLHQYRPSRAPDHVLLPLLPRPAGLPGRSSWATRSTTPSPPATSATFWRGISPSGWACPLGS